MRLGSTAHVLAQDRRPRISPAPCQSPSSWFCSPRVRQGCREMLQTRGGLACCYSSTRNSAKQNKPHPREGLQRALCLVGAQGRSLGAGNLADSLGASHSSFGHSASHPMSGCEGDLCSGPTRVKLAQAERYVWTELELTLMHTSLCQ